MIKIFIYSLLIFALPLGAKILTSPIDAMKNTYGLDSDVNKKNIIVSKKQAHTISQDAKAKLRSKIFRVFKATKDDNILGYGILINNKVRSKNAVVLYMISKDSVLKSIEIIAFNEPIEYLPSSKWNSQFENIPTDKMLRINKEIPTITGATLSARSITNSSRVAFAFYNEMLKDK